MKNRPILLVLCLLTVLDLHAEMKTDGTNAPLMLCDFSRKSTDRWQIVNDDVMGGVSSSTFSVSNNRAIFRGELSVDNGGGFTSVRTLPVDLGLKRGRAFLLRVRGDGRRYKFTARMDPGLNGAIYQSPFTTTKGEWQELALPLQDFVPSFRGRELTGQPPLTADRVASVGFLISDKQAGAFRLKVAWIKVAE